MESPRGREIVQQRVLKWVADHGSEGATIGKGSNAQENEDDNKAEI